MYQKLHRTVTDSHPGQQRVTTILLHILVVYLPHHLTNNHCLTRPFITPCSCSALKAVKSPLFYRILVLSFDQQTAGEKIRHSSEKLNLQTSSLFWSTFSGHLITYRKISCRKISSTAWSRGREGGKGGADHVLVVTKYGVACKDHSLQLPGSKFNSVSW